mmetsp:Transcript_12660/g.38750  ORF Transcript_12660/g.38750 Transcript_12660/m.38750 type:complete len:87 (+) Transcript_12660:1476-1736(+)
MFLWASQGDADVVHHRGAGATNRPQELDEAARRRLVKRLYIPLPDNESRMALVRRLLHGQDHSLAEDDFEQIANLTEGSYPAATPS